MGVAMGVRRCMEGWVVGELLPTSDVLGENDGRDYQDSNFTSPTRRGCTTTLGPRQHYVLWVGDHDFLGGLALRSIHCPPSEFSLSFVLARAVFCPDFDRYSAYMRFSPEEGGAYNPHGFISFYYPSQDFVNYLFSVKVHV